METKAKNTLENARFSKKILDSLQLEEPLSCAASFIFAKTSSETFYFTAILFLKWVTSEGKTVMF
jgi:hypothetical protein